MKILYFYAEFMGYQIPILKEYAQEHHTQVHVVHWDEKKLTPYKPPNFENVTYYNRSEYTKQQLKKLATNINPEIVAASFLSILNS